MGFRLTTQLVNECGTNLRLLRPSSSFPTGHCGPYLNQAIRELYRTFNGAGGALSMLSLRELGAMLLNRSSDESCRSKDGWHKTSYDLEDARTTGLLPQYVANLGSGPQSQDDMGYTSILGRRSRSARTPFYNDHALIDPSRATSDACYSLAFDIGELLAARRTLVQAPSFACRTYYVLLPPGVFAIADSSRFIGIPILRFMRRPDSASFRQTFSTSLLLIPADGSLEPRYLTDTETYAAVRDWSPGSPFESGPQYSVSGDLWSFLAPTLDKASNPAAQMQLPLWLAEICRRVLSLLLGESYLQDLHNIRQRLDDAVMNALSVSLVTGADLSIGMEIREIERFKRDQLQALHDVPAADAVHPAGRIIHAFVDGSDGPTISVLKKKFLAEPAADNELGVMNFYSPSFSTLWSISSNELERFPKSSLLWMSSWNLMILTSLSCLRQMCYTFKHEIEHTDHVQSYLSGGLDRDIIYDFDDHYDLHLTSSWFKVMYQAIKRRERLSDDYEKLRSEVALLSEQERAIAAAWGTRFSSITIAGAVVTVLLTLFSILINHSATQPTLPIFAAILGASAYATAISILGGPGIYRYLIRPRIRGEYRR